MRTLIAVGALTTFAAACGSSAGGQGSGSGGTKTITLTLAVQGPGEVRGSYHCRGNCTFAPAAGQTLHFEAAPDAQATFSGWSGACTGMSACDLNATSDVTLGAAFQGGTPPKQHHLSVVLDGSGSVVSDPGGIDCPARCDADFTDGTSVTLAAVPAAGFVFAGFGGACSGNSCALTVSADAQVSARFSRRPVVLSVQMIGSGEVVSNPAGIDCPLACSASFVPGTAVTLTPTAAAGFAFTGFGGACSGGSCTIALGFDAAVTATFTALHKLSVLMGGSGVGRVTSHPSGIDCPGKCDATFLDGAGVALVAKPDVLSRFGSWSGACSSDPCTVTLRQDAMVLASFDERRYRVRDLGTLPVAGWSNSSAISRSNLLIAGGSGNVFFWDGTMHDTGVQGDARGINDAGVVVGVTNKFHAYRWRNGTVTDLSTPGEMSSFAEGINNDGIVVGWAQSANAHARAFYWNTSGAVDLGSLNGDCSFAYGINSDGIIVGESCSYPIGLTHAVRFRKPGVIDDLGVLGGTYSRARAINDDGVIVGESTFDSSGVYHGFFHAGTSMIDAGTLPGMKYSSLYSVSSSGVAVGVATDGGNNLRGVVYGSGRMVDLNSLAEATAYAITFAQGIDDAGNIAGLGWSPYLGMRALLLQPE